MNWTKLAYHSFLTIVLGITLSVCSNVMETDDFEIEAIANSASIKYGTSNVSSGFNTIIFSSNFTNKPVVHVVIDRDNSNAKGISQTSISDITTTGFKYNCCTSYSETKIRYTAIGN